jgi:hypothetical protein
MWWHWRKNHFAKFLLFSIPGLVASHRILLVEKLPMFIEKKEVEGDRGLS